MVNLWKQEYLLDLDEIDTQHKHFFTLCGNVSMLAVTASGDKKSIKEVIRALGAMRSYAFLHFKTEEEIMLKFNYPDYLKHTGYHNGYLQKMMEFEAGFKAFLVDLGKKENDDDILKAFLKDVSEFVEAWWGDHIVNQDTKYATHIKERKFRK